jgi:hypothetical protein
MTPENLPDLYARVVAKRPELAVTRWDGLIGECVLRFVMVPSTPHTPACSVCNLWSERYQRFATETVQGPWSADNPDGLHEINCEVDTATAEDAILAKWVKALPCGGHLVHGHGTGASVQWLVELPERPMLLPSSPTPLEALAAFWLEYQP